MKIYQRNEENKYCGHWNSSPVEIGMAKLSSIPKGERLHSHEFREYYVVIKGKATLLVEGKEYQISDGMIAMVEPNEKHEVIWLEPEDGVHWVIIKEKSDPNGKKLH